MKRIRYRKMNKHLFDLEDKRNERISSCGIQNKEWFNYPTVMGTMFKEVKGEQRI